MIIIRRFYARLNFVGVSKKDNDRPKLWSRSWEPSVNIKSFFTAYEAFSIKILKGQDIYNSFIKENEWIYTYLNPEKLNKEKHHSCRD